MSAQYRPVPAQVDLPAMEREILAFWRDCWHLRQEH